MTIVALFALLIILFALIGIFGQTRYGTVAWTPLIIVLVVLVVLWLLGDMPTHS